MKHTKSVVFVFLTGMHKKSIEAASKMKEEEEDGEKKRDENDDVKSESIASLRARAQQHSSKMMQALHKGEIDTISSARESRATYDSSYMSDRSEVVRHVTH